MAKRKKPTQAELKAKRKKPTATKTAPMKVAHKNPPFSEIVKKAEGKKLVLHIGCSVPNPEKLHKSFRGDDWYEIRLDIDPDVNPDIVADMLDMSMIPDNSVNAVWSSHNIEHLFPHQVKEAMTEIYRVIKDEGHFLVTLPDIQTVAAYVAHGGLEDPIYDSSAGPIAPIDILYGFRKPISEGNHFMAHKTGFTAKTLGLHLRDTGFTNIKVNRDWVDLWAIGYKMPMGHPERVEKMAIGIKSSNNQVKLPPPMPINRTPHPGRFSNTPLTDELDIPPKVWQPLGLKKAK